GKFAYFLALPLLSTLLLAVQMQPAAREAQEPALPYSPSLDLTSMDRSVNPCDDLYHYACGNWQNLNPIPADQTSWSVYGKLFEDNLNFLHGILEDASADKPSRDQVTREVGDYYAACMNTAAVEKRGLEPVEGQLGEIAKAGSYRDLPALVARLQLDYGNGILFSGGSAQDLDNSEKVIADLDQGGLGLPDRDYYTKEDAKSKETRARYVQHVEKVFSLMGEGAEAAKADAATVMAMETALAEASQTQVARRDPYALKHKMDLAGLAKLAPNFDWKTYYRTAGYPEFTTVNVDSPDFYKAVNAKLASEPIANWKAYLRFHVVDAASPFLSQAFVDENFEMYRKYLRGAKEQQPRWK
ncbi:MAG: M13 family peptidase, partial [Bryobacteraceae bacterium]